MFVFTHKQAGAGSGTSCVQHSLHPVHVEAVVLPPPPPASDFNISLSKSNKSVLLPFLNSHGLAWKLDNICTQKLPKFLDNVWFLHTNKLVPALVPSCLQHSLHPVHVEAVVGLVGRADLLAALLTLSSLLLFSPHTTTLGAEVLNNVITKNIDFNFRLNYNLATVVS
jgi:hypothetical protein